MKTTANSLTAWLRQARDYVASITGARDDAALETALLAAFVFGKNRTWISSHPDAELTVERQEELNRLTERLAQGEPLAYLTNRREFFGQEFIVSPSVLVPRPETELMVEHALAWLQSHPTRRDGSDVGCGSGCIGITLALRVPDLKMTAIDLSSEALAIARQNAAKHRVSDRCQFIETNLLSGIHASFDLVCANLPYIPSDDLITLPVASFEPLLALDGGPDGLELIRRLLSELPDHINAGGLILLEIEYRQGPPALDLARAFFPFAECNVMPDLAGLDRLLSIQLP